jgi:adenosyl cobinamide kinase/adenosyl cobinamide phosphate guanylyltransferase
MSVTLLLGGARSGKSSFAVRYAEQHGGRVVYLATAPPLDDDMERRIARHREERPGGWETIEEPIDLIGAFDRVGDETDVLIIDCLTLWTSNLMWHGRSDDAITDAAEEAANRCRSRAGQAIVISNEVGLGVHPDTPLGRRYRDVLGLVNQRWADVADDVLLMVAGRALRLHSPADLLDLHGDGGDLR